MRSLAVQQRLANANDTRALTTSRRPYTAAVRAAAEQPAAELEAQHAPSIDGKGTIIDTYA